MKMTCGVWRSSAVAVAVRVEELKNENLKQRFLHNFGAHLYHSIQIIDEA